MTRQLRFSIGFVLIVLASLSSAHSASMTARDWVSEFIKQRDAVKSFEADVTTTIESTLFASSQVQTAHLTQKGNEYRRMDYLTPMKSTSIMTPKEIISVDALGNVNRSPVDHDGQLGDLMNGGDPQAVFDALNFTITEETDQTVVLKGSPAKSGADLGFSVLQATFSKAPVLLTRLELFNDSTRLLDMTMSYITIDKVPMLTKTVVGVEMLPPGQTKPISLKTTMVQDHIKLNQEIPLSKFEVED